MITSENAIECQVKSLAKRAKLKQERANARAIAELAAGLQQNGVNDFVFRKLARVRVQIDRLDMEIDDAIDGDSKRLKELTDSMDRLCELERKLSGRPLPGSRRPREDRKPSRSIVEPMSDPTPVETATPRDDPNEPNG